MSTSRRLFCKAVAAVTSAAVSCGILLPSANAAPALDPAPENVPPAAEDVAIASGAAKQEWVFPDHAQITHMMNDRDYTGGDAMWHSRAMSFVDAMWPAMVVAAAKQGVGLSEKLYEDMLMVSDMEAFIAANPDTPEAEKVRKYLVCLPGYELNKLHRDTEIHHGFLTMQVTHALRLSKERIA